MGGDVVTAAAPRIGIGAMPPPREPARRAPRRGHAGQRRLVGDAEHQQRGQVGRTPVAIAVGERQPQVPLHQQAQHRPPSMQPQLRAGSRRRAGDLEPPAIGPDERQAALPDPRQPPAQRRLPHGQRIARQRGRRRRVVARRGQDRTRVVMHEGLAGRSRELGLGNSGSGRTVPGSGAVGPRRVDRGGVDVRAWTMWRRPAAPRSAARPARPAVHAAGRP